MDPGDETVEKIRHRAISAALLAAVGTFTTWSLCSLLATLGIPGTQPLNSMIAAHDPAILALGAYCVGSAPYGWSIAGDWLVPPLRFGPAARAQALRSAVLATIAIGPFLAPAALINDVRSLLELADSQRTSRRDQVRVIPHAKVIEGRAKPTSTIAGAGRGFRGLPSRRDTAGVQKPDES